MLDWYMYIYFKFFRSRLDFKFSVSKIMNGILYNKFFLKMKYVVIILFINYGLYCRNWRSR